MTTNLGSLRVVPLRKDFRTVPSPHWAGKQTMRHCPCRAKECMGTIGSINMGKAISSR